ncbi:hypothetical protein ACO1O0_006596 [Amphichorda felina]
MAVRSLLTAFIAFTSLQAASGLPSRAPRGDDEYQVGYINVSVSTLWTNSGKPRPVDAPAISSPVDIQGWLDSMTVDEFRDLTDHSRTQTQALYGARVYILETGDDGWYKVAVPGQANPDVELGYPGWVPSSQVQTDKIASFAHQVEHRPIVQVTGGNTVPLYSNRGLTKPIMDVAFNTRLPLSGHPGKGKKAVEVAVPGGVAYLAASDVSIYGTVDDIPRPQGKDLVETGKLFIGRPYLWGGTSGFAYDCSGFTHSMHLSHGLTIPRDAGPQAFMEGYGNVPVEQADLVPGDLMFYANNVTNAESIYHVAMYAGDGEMLEAYSAGVAIRLTEARFGENYWGAVRFIHE